MVVRSLRAQGVWANVHLVGSTSHLQDALLAPSVASPRASRRPDEPLDGPPGAPDGGLCTGLLPPSKRTSEKKLKKLKRI